MPRKVETVTIDREGRDKGKSYVLTEMAAAPAEKWALRLLNAAARNGLQIPDGVAELGMQGVAIMLAVNGMGSLAGIAWVDMEPLLDEMMACVQFKTSANIVRDILPEADDIEEIFTRVQLRGAILRLHVDPSLLAGLSTSESAPDMTSATPITSTSRPVSE